MTEPSSPSNKRIRALHIGKFFPPAAGGMEYFLGDLLPALDRAGISAGALVHAHTTDKKGDRTTTANQVWRVPCYGSLLYTPVSPSFPFWLARVIREFRPSLLHFHVPNVSAFWAMTVPAAQRLPWVTHWHSDVVPSQIDRRLSMAYRFYRPFEQRLLRKSTAVIATSPPYLNTSQALRSWQDKSKVIALGLDPERLAEPDSKMTTWADSLWGDADFRILSVGRLTYYKGHEVLVKAMEKMKGCRLIIIGEGEQRGSLERQIRSSGLSNTVILPGGQPEKKLNALLATCDCFCLPSVERTEAFGIVLLEAMRFGKPLVVSDIPGSGTGWVVEHEKNGLLTVPGDVKNLADMLSELQNNPGRRKQLGENGLARFKENFHIDSVAEKIKELYQNIIV